MLKAGDRAPEVDAVTATGERFRLSDHRGKSHVVLYFYPKDFTPGCTRQACGFRDRFAEILQTGAILVGISSDDEESHRRFSSAHLLPFPLITDRNGSIAQRYGVVRPFVLLFPVRRCTYVIDTGGFVRGVVHRELLIDRHIDEVLAILRKLDPARVQRP